MDFSDKYVTRIPLNQIWSAEGSTAEQINKLRLSNYRIFWRYYYGDHYGFKEEEGESQIVLNYCKAIINKLVNFTTFGGVSFLPDKWSNSLVSPIIDEVWEDNDKNRMIYEVTLMGSITGDDFVEVSYDDEEDRVILTLLDSSICFPVWDTLDKRIMKEFHIIYKSASDSDKTKKQETNVYKKKITSETVTETIDGKVSSIENPYGFINIVHWPNIPIPGYFFGLSDITDLIGLNSELNEKISNMSSIINYHESPIIVVKGAKKTEMGKGVNRIWSGLPKDAEVTALVLDSDLSSTLEFIKLLKTAMHEVSGVPARALGGIEGGISNTSSVALHVEYQPLLEILRIKRGTLGKGLSEVNRMILKVKGTTNTKLKNDLNKLDEQIKEIKYEDGGETFTKKIKIDPFKVETIFKDPLPKDKLAVLQMVTQKLQNTVSDIPQPLISVRRALEEIGEEDIDDLLQEIANDFKDLKEKRKDFLETEEKEKVNLTGIVRGPMTPKGAAKEIGEET